VLEYVVALNQASQIVPAPIDQGTEPESVILLLYGTGLRLRTDLSTVRVQIGGVERASGNSG
jgi:hypothetical protein